jgi:hypothetical protein
VEHLQEQLDQLLAQVPDADAIRARLDNLVSVYPFNEYEYIISHLLAAGVLTLDAYRELRENYINRNRLRELFTLGPTAFGISWAQNHLLGLVPGLQKPTGKSEFDLMLEGTIRVEVKASRAVDRNSSKPLFEKALTSDSLKPFLMNFQQTKPRHFDVIIWIGVWLDTIRYWVHSSHEVESHARYSRGQHRGNVGEGQLHVRQDNIRDFDEFQVRSNDLRQAIVDAYARELSQRSGDDSTT